ncbi:hypothetical protein KC336_g34 [Hortaea werneckii]|nr:hypothetical protein KC336_g34 [Hortaea werneckii]
MASVEGATITTTYPTPSFSSSTANLTSPSLPSRRCASPISTSEYKQLGYSFANTVPAASLAWSTVEKIPSTSQSSSCRWTTIVLSAYVFLRFFRFLSFFLTLFIDQTVFPLCQLVCLNLSSLHLQEKPLVLIFQVLHFASQLFDQIRCIRNKSALVGSELCRRV